MTKINNTNRLVGHRGTMKTHPENTLTAFKAAINAGAFFIECDLQLTKDKQVVILHDDSVNRTSGAIEGSVNGSIFDLTLAEAQATSVHCPDYFGVKYYPEPIATLAQLLELLPQYPDVTAMIELKQESINQFGLADFTERVCAVAEPYMAQVVMISFNPDVVSAAKKAGFSTGWVVEEMNQSSQLLANQLMPDYIITDVDNVDEAAPELWHAPAGHLWYWMLYDVMDAQVATRLMDKGVNLIETGDMCGMIDQL